MKRILVIDDFRANVIMMQQALNGKYEVFTATSGKEALHIIRGSKPDLVVSDIQMPEMTGIELLQKMKEDEEMKRIPVVFLTGQADREKVTQGYRLGIRDVIAKPIIIKTVEERIRRVFDKLEKEEQQRAQAKELEELLSEETLDSEDSFKDLFDDDFWSSSDWESVL